MSLPVPESQEPTTAPSNHENDSQLDSLRDLLLAKEKQQLQALQQQNLDAAQQIHQLQAQLAALQHALADVQDAAAMQRSRAHDLQTQIDQLKSELKAELKAESDAMIPRLIRQMSHIITETIRNSRDEMAAALGPVMSEAIRVQIRDSRKSMVEALYPIILETVQRAIAAFARELQINIDARLKSTFQFRELGRTVRARLRGISPSELALRDALPFAVQELFLAQHESGLLMAHSSTQPDEASDSDLISGMLTAIRDFARDSFGDGDETDELDEIQYGDERIIIQSGQFAYVAAVITGVEPAGFRTRLREFLVNLHLHHSHKLRDYAGDPLTLPQSLAADFATLGREMQEANTAVSRPLSQSEKSVLVWGGLAGVALVILACFYLQFTLALWPVAFGAPTATATNTPLPTVTTVVIVEPSPSAPTETPPPVATNTPTLTPTPVATNTPSATPVPPTATPLPTITPMLLTSRTNAPVWIRPFPDNRAPTDQVILADTAVTILSQYGEWVEVAWQNSLGQQNGWVPLQWITLSQPIPADIVTPVILAAPTVTSTVDSGG